MVQEEGLGKARYKWFTGLLATARVNFYEGWTPWTLVDDMRSAVVRGDGFSSPDAWLRAMQARARVNLDYWRSQPYYVELWFEANAMRRQFEHYTEHVTLRPFGGDPSIAYKWEAVQALERAAEKCDRGAIILYFGDWDQKGESIPTAAQDTIMHWQELGECGVEFELVRVALNAGDGERYGLTENPERPGCYQWEALDDATARALITGAVSKYVDHDAMAEVTEREERATSAFRGHLAGCSLEDGNG